MRPLIILQLFLVVCARGGHDDLFGCDNESTLCCCSAVKHLFDHGLKGAHDFALGHILCPALDLIALKALRVVNGNCDLAIIGSEAFASLYVLIISDI